MDWNQLIHMLYNCSFSSARFSRGRLLIVSVTIELEPGRAGHIHVHDAQNTTMCWRRDWKMDIYGWFVPIVCVGFISFITFYWTNIEFIFRSIETVFDRLCLRCELCNLRLNFSGVIGDTVIALMPRFCDYLIWNCKWFVFVRWLEEVGSLVLFSNASGSSGNVWTYKRLTNGTTI